MQQIFLFILIIILKNFALAGEIILIDEAGLYQEITTTARDEKKVLLFFTSWCPHCKNTVLQLTQDFPKDERVFIISLDKDFKKLSSSKDHYPDGMPIYFLTSPDEIRNVFSRFKIKYGNSVPHITILNSDNKILKDNATLRQVSRYLK